MTNNKNPTKPILQTSRSSPGDSAFGNSLFISQSPFQEHLDSSTPIIDVQSPSLYLSKDLLSKLDEQSPCAPLIQDKHFTYILDDFIQINNNNNNNQIYYYHSNNKDKQKSNNSNSNGYKKRKYFRERIGDWVCYRCNNLNFSFRTICNRCKIDKTTSQQLHSVTLNKK